MNGHNTARQTITQHQFVRNGRLITISHYITMLVYHEASYFHLPHCHATVNAMHTVRRIEG